MNPRDRLEDDPLRSGIVTRRMARFFNVGGLCEAYERRGNRLIQLSHIASVMADSAPGLSRESVIRRFLFSAEAGWFGRHGTRGTIEKLLDLDAYSTAPRTKYSLRPSYIRTEASPELMRAPRSVWARWIEAMGWPVPAELAEANPQQEPASDSGNWQDSLPLLKKAVENVLIRKGPYASFQPGAIANEVARLQLGETATTDEIRGEADRLRHRVGFRSKAEEAWNAAG